MESYIWIVPLAPLVGSLINAFFGHILKERSGYVAVAAMVIAFIFSVRAFFVEKRKK